MAETTARRVTRLGCGLPVGSAGALIPDVVPADRSAGSITGGIIQLALLGVLAAPPLLFHVFDIGGGVAVAGLMLLSASAASVILVRCAHGRGG